MKKLCLLSVSLALVVACTGNKDPVAAVDINGTAIGSADASGPFQGSIAECGERVSGNLGSSSPYHFWHIGSQCNNVRIDLTSADGDMFLFLYEESESGFEIIEYNDDCVGLDSCLELPLSGSYLIGASTYDYVQSGQAVEAEYTLTVECADQSLCPDYQACGGRGNALCGEGEYCFFEESASCGAADAPGVCLPIPDACTAELAPVCGCDGQTHANASCASLEGVSVLHDGPCETEEVTCGGFAGDTCGADEYCYFEAGTYCDYADATGVCRPRPEACAEILAPVCGCDGRTYGNQCHAASAGASVYHVGECEAQTRACGTRGGVTCESGEYCHFEESAMCGATDVGGECRTLPEACAEILAPVCGCDGQTYGNDCYANAAGVSVASTGECAGSGAGVGEICGGIAGIICQEGLTCDMSEQMSCGADLSGLCADNSGMPCTFEVAPVCGCDGVTYSNDCERRRAGAAFAYDGECR